MPAELEPLATTTGTYAFVVLLGTLWGSFANVCIYRIPDELSVVAPGSHCVACKAPIRWYDNVPLLSYLWLRGKCRSCKAAFSPRYLVVEALTGALFGLAWWFAMADFTMPFDERLIHFAIPHHRLVPRSDRVLSPVAIVGADLVRGADRRGGWLRAAVDNRDAL